MECVKLTNGFSFDQDVYEKIYKTFEKSIYSSFSVHKLTAPLEGFFGNVGEINFGNSIKLRPFIEEEKKSYIQQFSFPYPSFLPNIDLHPVSYILEGLYTQAKNTTKKTSKIKNDFKEIVTLLRLFKLGNLHTYL